MTSIETWRTTRMGWVSVAKSLAPPALWRALHRLLVIKDIPDAEQYTPLFSPWLSPEFRRLYDGIKTHTVVQPERAWTLYTLLNQSLAVSGDVLEAGVFQGGTAKLLKGVLSDTKAQRTLFLFDSFEGMKAVTARRDRHRENDFSDTSVEAVTAVVGSEPWVEFRKGWVPQTFEGLEGRTFCFAHIDLDLYQGVLDCLTFVYPRLSPGGSIVFDDYGFASCPGARQAVDEFFAGKPERPLALMTGQAIVTKLASA